MYTVLALFVHLIVTVARLIKPSRLRAALTRHQILILNRSRKRAPNLRVSDRIIACLCTLLSHFGLRRGRRQRRSAADSWKTLPARVRMWRSVLADLSRSGERQFVEHRAVSL